MKKLLVVFLALMLVFCFAACGGGADGGEEGGEEGGGDAAIVDNDLRFVTGGESGTYYAFGSVIAQHATNNAGVKIVGLVGNGSQGNVMEMEDGNAELAFCQSDVMSYAYEGTNLFADTGAFVSDTATTEIYTERGSLIEEEQ